MGTFSETICKHRILFPSIGPTFSVIAPGASPGEFGKNLVKIAFFGLTH